MKSKRDILAGILIFCLFFLNTASAQFYNGSQLTFGKNRVQWVNFQWTYYQFDRFDTYFYLNGKELATYTAQVAQSQLAGIEKHLETRLDEKIQFIIFNTLTDLKQSNLGLLQEGDNYNTGGITRILDQKVILYYPGDHREFQKQIRRGITHVVLNQMLFGSTLTSQVKNNTLLFLPDWYLQGLISYLTEEWNTGIDGRVRDGIQSGRYRRFNQLTGEEAAFAGHSIWKYVADKYGQAVVPNIIYMAKISKNVESGFMFVLGVSFKSIIRDWISFFNARYEADGSADSLPPPAQLVLKTRAARVITSARLNPEGDQLAYTTNESGQYRVFIRDLKTNKQKRILKRGYKLDAGVDYSYPLLSWHPSGKLVSMLTEEKGKINLYFYTPASGRTDRRFLFQFDKVLDMSYSPDGRNFIMSAVIKGQTDLFLYNIAANTFEQLTKDIYDDLNPRFTGGGKKIVFSSNRPDESLDFSGKSQFRTDFAEKHDLYVMDLKGRKTQLRRITATPDADERQPVEYSSGYISYFSDQNGIFNRYLARFDSAVAFVDTITHYRYFTVSYPLTNYLRNILDQDVSPQGGRHCEIIFHDNRNHLYVADNLPTGSLPSRQLNPTAYMTEIRTASVRRQEDSLQMLKKDYQGRKKRFYNVRKSEQEAVSDSLTNVDSGKIDINNYVFEKQAFIKLAARDSSQTAPAIPVVATGSDKGDRSFTVPKQLNYLVEYSINELVSQVDFTYLNTTYQTFSGGTSPIFLNPGFNALLQVGATDLMENYRITGGVRLSLNLSNNEYLLNFANLKDRLDKEITFHRQVIENTSESPAFSIVKTTSHQVLYKLSWPFSEVMGVRGTASLRNDHSVYLSTDEQNLRQPDYDRNWASLKAEWVYDATRSLGLNLPYGTRCKVFGEYYQQMEGGGKNLYVAGLDIRNYRRLHRTMIWANRLAASTSLGSNRLIYYLGGVDNWLAPRFNQDVPVSQDRPYAYQTLATNMRGFTQNIRNGTSFAVLNSEIRLPVFRYFTNRPLKSDFINNFQLIAFGDIGTAWNGPGPYSKENSLYRRVITQGPITVTIENQVEPIVGGYGFGLRTRFLGYFLRCDWAWGIEDFEPGKGIFYVSLSLDF